MGSAVPPNVSAAFWGRERSQTVGDRLTAKRQFGITKTGKRFAAPGLSPQTGAVFFEHAKAARC